MELLNEFGFLDCKPMAFPVDTKAKFSKVDKAYVDDVANYRRLVGKLLYLTITRPDITYGVHVLTQFMNKPGVSHLGVAHRLLRYLKGTLGQGLFYPSDSELRVKGFSDADWAACVDTRRSVTGFAVFLGDSLVCWRSKKQSVVSRSSAEAEYRALALTSCEVLWVIQIMKDFGINLPNATIFCDSKAALSLAANPVNHDKMKHVEIDCHFIKEKIQAGLIHTLYVSTKHQIADLFTKALSSIQFHYLVSKMGVHNIHSHLEGECWSRRSEGKKASADDDKQQLVMHEVQTERRRKEAA